MLRNGTAESSDIVLAGEWLFGVVHANAIRASLSRILDREAGVQIGRALVECPTAVPVIGSAFGRDYDGSGGGPTCVGVFVRCTYGKFLNAIRREILQK